VSRLPVAHDATLPLEFQFLTSTSKGRQLKYRTAEWLRSAFESPLWKCVFDGFTSFEIDFAVRLEDGQLLTSARHETLLLILKCWLCVQTHRDATGGRILSPASAMPRITRTLYVIDYLLLNAENLQLASFGLQLVTENDWKGLILALAKSGSVATALYSWPTRLSAFLRRNGGTLSEGALRRATDRSQFLALDIPPEEDRYLELTTEEIIRARAWLWCNGFYEQTSRMPFRFTIAADQLDAILYANTLRRIPKISPLELLLCPVERYTREYSAAPVKATGEGGLSRRRLDAYRTTIRRLGLLSSLNLPVPSEALRALDLREVEQTIKLKAVRRFKTLPHQAVLNSLRDAIEFSLAHGDAIVDGYIATVTAAHAAGESCAIFAANHSIIHLLPKQLRRLGVKTWSIDPNQQRRQRNGIRPRGSAYFTALRKNEGLWELLKILYGSTLMATGALMARRSGELGDLIAGKCLDTARTRLIFFNRKSGVMGLREIESRPIPKIVAQMIRQLERIHFALRTLGLADEDSLLFAYPHWSKNALLTLADHSRLCNSLDIFCDYFETPLDKDGRRYYYRLHQLRRFFAMLFFWCESFGGMNTLRWFLGHTDMKSLYHYITEATPGAVLISIKARFGAERIRTGDTEGLQLADYIERRFGTRNVSILDSEELADYVEELLLERTVTIEPVFFDTTNGQAFRVAIHVRTEEFDDDR